MVSFTDSTRWFKEWVPLILCFLLHQNLWLSYFLILDMALQVFLHKTAITKVFLPGVGVEKGPTNRMKQAKTKEPSVNDWGNARSGEDRKSEEEMHTHMTRLLPDVELLVSVIREERRGLRTLPVNNVPQGKPGHSGPAANTMGMFNCSGRKAGPLSSLSLWQASVTPATPPICGAVTRNNQHKNVFMAAIFSMSTQWVRLWALNAVLCTVPGIQEVPYKSTSVLHSQHNPRRCRTTFSQFYRQRHCGSETEVACPWLVSGWSSQEMQDSSPHLCACPLHST